MKKLSTGLKFAAVVSALLVAGCASKKEVPPPEAPPPAPMAAPAPAPVSSIVPGSAEDLRVNVGDTVHFDYDQYSLTDEDKGTLQRQSSWLQKYPAVRVTIEGHADERGTREYNLALGARRANAVKEYLASLGVSSSRLETVSYGKERPVCTQSDEGCYAQNRRGVTTISGGAASS